MTRRHSLDRGVFLAMVLMSGSCSTINAPSDPVTRDGFSDAINHWYNRTERLDAPLHKASDTEAIAENILLYQRCSGGWPENTHPQRMLASEEEGAVMVDKEKMDASFDNRNIYPQVT